MRSCYATHFQPKKTHKQTQTYSSFIAWGSSLINSVRLINPCIWILYVYVYVHVKKKKNILCWWHYVLISKPLLINKRGPNIQWRKIIILLILSTSLPYYITIFFDGTRIYKGSIFKLPPNSLRKLCKLLLTDNILAGFIANFPGVAGLAVVLLLLI